MDYKQVLFYAVVFISGFLIGKIIKFDVKNSGGCPIARKKLEELRKQLQSESSENYL